METLTEEQNQVYNKCLSWLKEGPGNVLVVDSIAGSGKSQVLSAISKTISEKFNEEYEGYKTMVLTPTHKSRIVLDDRLPPELRNRTKTITSKLVKKVSTDVKGKLDFFYSKEKLEEEISKSGGKKVVIFVDEFSMLKRQEFIELRLTNENANVFFIYFGDSCQLPPVKENEIVVYKNYKENVVSLCRVERTRDPYIIKNCFEIPRKQVIKGKFSDKSSEFIEENTISVEELIKLYDRKGGDVIITYTNEKKDYYNKIVENIWRESENLPKVEESPFLTKSKVICSKTFQIVGTSEKTKRVLKLPCLPGCSFNNRHGYNTRVFNYSSEKFTIKSYLGIEKWSLTFLENSEERTSNNFKRFLKSYKIEKSLESVPNGLEVNVLTEKEQCKLLKVFDNLGNFNSKRSQKKFSNLKEKEYKINVKVYKTECESFYVRVPSIEVREKLKKVNEDSLFGDINGNRQTKRVLKKYRSNLNEALDFLNTPVEYSYAMTCHKSQGSTFENVFIDIEDIRKMKDDFLRAYYTAVSRTNKRVYFIKS